MRQKYLSMIATKLAAVFAQTAAVRPSWAERLTRSSSAGAYHSSLYVASGT